MLRAYKYELAPTPEQAHHLSRICGSVRFVYNLALESKIQAYAKGVNVTCFELMRQLTDLKQACEWLYESPTHALQHAISNLDTAFTNFFKRRADFPKFKRKRQKQSFHIPAGTKVDFEKNRVFLPKLKWVAFHNSRSFTGTIRSSTVSKTPTGRYFVSVLVETGTATPTRQPVQAARAVGVDVGIKDFAILSDGQKIANPKFLFHSLNRLRVEQRTLQRRFKKGAKAQSQNYQKQRLLVAKLHEKVANQRKDFLHKTSTAIVKQYDSICVEDLHIAGMVQNRKLARSISDVGWGLFKTMLRYKCEWQGKNLLEIGRFEPSSRICATCGWHNKDLKLSDRTWTCTNGHTVDRDVNAALNIKTFGLRTQPSSVNATR